MKEIAVITGATRGIGKALASHLSKYNYYVIALGRDQKKLDELKEEGIPEIYKIDLRNLDEIQNIINQIKSKHSQIDILVNNAGIYNTDDDLMEFLETNELLDSLQINSFAPMKMIQKTIALLKNSKNPRIINISSGMGAIQDMGSGAPAYRMSKTILNTITILFHHELFNKYKIRINAVCPGWVRTEMGGSSAPRSIEQGIAGILWLIDTNKDGPSGKFFRDGQEISW
jgi:NAD(P)-dependent dehydrogenase (short-subunit alcohol dehydrogenase family)